MRSFAPLVLAASLALAAPAPVTAQAPMEAARALFEEGVDHAARGEWEAALTAFRSSYERYPRGRTLFNVAVALDRLDRGAACLRAVDALLARDDVDAADRAEAEQLRARWRPRVGALRLRVEPPDARLVVDGEAIEGEGASRVVWLDPGRHRVRIEAGPRLAPAERTVELGAGGEARLEITLAPAPTVTAGVQLRRLDRATVRLIGVRGARALQPTGGVPATVVPLAAHGSGVAIGSGGWILTARHVVEGADRVVALLPGETRALATRTVWLDPERDLALVQASEPIPSALDLDPPPPLVAGQDVDASGYPLDPVERWPNASSGAIGRPLNDGRVQLSIALNPGNSGGPVAVDGRLIGIVSQGGDPGRGVQGVAVMEPVAPVLEALHGHLASPVAPPSPDPVDDVLVELLGAAASPPTVRRVARVRRAASDPDTSSAPTGIESALWAFEAEAARRAILGQARVSTPASLPPDLRASYDELTALASSFAAGLDDHPTLAARYQPLRALTATVRHGEWECGFGGVCAQRREPRPRGQGWLFDLTFTGGLAIDDHPNASFVEGAVGSVIGLFHLGNFGRLDPVRFNVVLGAELGLGSWRGAVVFDFLADVGLRFEVGTPDFALALQLLYTPGPITAEGRWSFAYLAYRATAALQMRSFAVGLSWREVGRQADDVHRAWELFLSWGF